MQDMDIDELSEKIRAYVKSARTGLPQEVFYLVSELTPLVNVDLLIKDGEGRTLLTWRADKFYGPGWHVPGGIIRFKEYASARGHAVALAELGASVEIEQHPLAVREVMAPNRDIRGHFISLLYRCKLLSQPNPETQSAQDAPTHGQWMWHLVCPSNIIKQHEMYRSFIDGTGIPMAAIYR